uniref:Uncharacterized protein n=1 Tax=Sphaerodactylus townsendi TaxID=933632 RepID=A0ACB8E751_9SAUR
MESLAVILGKISTNQEVMYAEQRKCNGIEESKEETGAILALQKFQKEMKEDLAAEINSSQLEIKCVLQEIKEAWMEMELRLNTQANLVTLMKEVCHKLSSIKVLQNMPESHWNCVAEDGEQQAFQYLDEKVGSIHKWEYNGVSKEDYNNVDIEGKSLFELSKLMIE